MWLLSLSISNFYNYHRYNRTALKSNFCESHYAENQPNSGIIIALGWLNTKYSYVPMLILFHFIWEVRNL